MEHGKVANLVSSALLAVLFCDDVEQLKEQEYQQYIQAVMSALRIHLKQRIKKIAKLEADK